MATTTGVSNSWDNWGSPNQFVGQPVDLGGVRQGYSSRGKTYDTRGDEAYDWGRTRADEIGKTGDEVTKTALDTSRTFNDFAKKDRATYDQNYVPAMLEQLAFARDYTTEGRKAANRGGAMADVSMTFDAAADLARRNLQSYGVNPAAGRFAGLDASVGTQRAKALAGAGTKSDRDTEMMGQQLLDNAIGRGAVLPGQAVNQAGVGIAAGNQAINTGLATAGAQRGLREPTGWVGAGDQQLRNFENSLLQQTKLGMEQNQFNEQMALAREKLAQGSSSGMGAAMGGGMGMLGSLMKTFGGGMMGGGGGGGGLGDFTSMGGSMMGGADMSMSGMTFKRGGMVPKVRQKFAWGGMAAPDVKPIKSPWGGQDLDVYDPGAQLWGNLGEVDNPEGEDDQGEGIGRGVGGTAGGLIGSIWGPIGAMAGREIGQKVGGGIGAAVQGKWGEAAENLAEGTPLDMFFAEGGQVPEGDEDEIAMGWEEDEAVTPGVDGENMVPGSASPSNGATTDDVTAQVSAGEFIVPKDVTAWYGEKYMQGLIEKARKEMMNRTAAPEMGPPPAGAAMSPTFQSQGAMQ